MQERIGFKDDATREDFFLSVREGSGTNSWKELMRILCLPRTRFQRYKYGEALLSRQVFDSMLKFLPKEEQDAFIEKVIVKSENWGAIKGGKNNYKKNWPNNPPNTRFYCITEKTEYSSFLFF